MRGSKFELKFDNQGKPINEDEIRQILRRDCANESANNVISMITAAPNSKSVAMATNSMNMFTHGSHLITDMQSHSNMSHQISKDQIATNYKSFDKFMPQTDKTKKTFS